MVINEAKRETLGETSLPTLIFYIQRNYMKMDVYSLSHPCYSTHYDSLHKLMQAPQSQCNLLLVKN